MGPLWSWSSVYIVIFVDSFLFSRWLRFLVRRVLSIPILFLTVLLQDLYCSSLRSFLVNRSARLWWYFTSASTRACSAFFLIEPISFLNRRLSSSSGVHTLEMCSRCVNSLCCLNDSSDKFFDSSAMSNAAGREWAGFFMEQSMEHGVSRKRRPRKRRPTT